MTRTLARFLRDENGATAIEYSLIAALISVAAISAFQTVGSQLGLLFGFASDQVASVQY